MPGKKEIPHKWAVENRRLDTGEVLRLLETPQDWTAELICDNANRAFKESRRDHLYESSIIQLY